MVIERFEDSFDSLERIINTLNEGADQGLIPDPNKTMLIAQKLISATERFRKILNEEQSEISYLSAKNWIPGEYK